jgi:hypothetical protein
MTTLVFGLAALVVAFLIVSGALLLASWNEDR